MSDKKALIENMIEFENELEAEHISLGKQADYNGLTNWQRMDIARRQQIDDDYYEMLESITADYQAEETQERRSFISIIVNVFFN